MQPKATPKGFVGSWWRRILPCHYQSGSQWNMLRRWWSKGKGEWWPFIPSSAKSCRCWKKPPSTRVPGILIPKTAIKGGFNSKFEFKNETNKGRGWFDVWKVFFFLKGLLIEGIKEKTLLPRCRCWFKGKEKDIEGPSLIFPLKFLGIKLKIISNISIFPLGDTVERSLLRAKASFHERGFC